MQVKRRSFIGTVLASIGSYWLPKPVVAEEESVADIEDILELPYLEPLPNETLYEYALRKTAMLTHDMQMLMHLKHGCPERLCRYRHIPENIQYNNSILYTYFKLRRSQLAKITAEERQKFFEELPDHVRDKWKGEAQYIGSLRQRNSFSGYAISRDHRFVPMEAENLGCRYLNIPIPTRLASRLPELDEDENVEDCIHTPYGEKEDGKIG
jgi:hypothetical protein